MKTLLLILLPFLTRAQQFCEGVNASFICNSTVGVIVKDDDIFQTWIAAPYVILENITADSVCLFIRDSFRLTNSDVTSFRVDTVNCSQQVMTAMAGTNTAIIYNDLIRALIDDLFLRLEELKSLGCDDMQKPVLEMKANEMADRMDFVVEFRDSMENNLSGNNLLSFQFRQQQDETDINVIYEYLSLYISLLSENPCDRIAIRMTGRLYFVEDSLKRLRYSHGELGRIIQ